MVFSEPIHGRKGEMIELFGAMVEVGGDKSYC